MYNGWKVKSGGQVKLISKDVLTNDVRVWFLNPNGTWTTNISAGFTVTKRNPLSVFNSR